MLSNYKDYLTSHPNEWELVKGKSKRLLEDGVVSPGFIKKLYKASYNIEEFDLNLNKVRTKIDLLKYKIISKDFNNFNRVNGYSIKTLSCINKTSNKIENILLFKPFKIGKKYQ